MASLEERINLLEGDVKLLKAALTLHLEEFNIVRKCGDEEKAPKEFNLTLTSLDRTLYQKLRSHLTVEWQQSPPKDGKTFTSDDFRGCGLCAYLQGDLTHAVGGVFARWVHGGLIREVGQERSEIPSNRMRKVKLYEFVEAGEDWV